MSNTYTIRREGAQDIERDSQGLAAMVSSPVVARAIARRLAVREGCIVEVLQNGHVYNRVNGRGRVRGF